MGIVWPDRNLTQHPLADYETEYLCHEVEQHGISMWGIVTALRGSSTRCELAIAIMAALIASP